SRAERDGLPEHALGLAEFTSIVVLAPQREPLPDLFVHVAPRLGSGRRGVLARTRPLRDAPELLSSLGCFLAVPVPGEDGLERSARVVPSLHRSVCTAEEEKCFRLFAAPLVVTEEVLEPPDGGELLIVPEIELGDVELVL